METFLLFTGTSTDVVTGSHFISTYTVVILAYHYSSFTSILYIQDMSYIQLSILLKVMFGFGYPIFSLMCHCNSPMVVG